MTEAADTIDAVADVMLSESVLQYVGGNHTRAAVAMDAMGTGSVPADTVDILDDDSGERLTHRVLAPWSATAPRPRRGTPRCRRAVVEPTLEAWAARHLGDPSSIVVAEDGGNRTTLDAAGICAVDLVFVVDLAALERSLRTVIPAIGDAPLAVRRRAGGNASLRALGQMVPLATACCAKPFAAAQLLLPADLCRAGGTPTRTLDIADLTAWLAQLVGGLEAAVAASGSAVAQLPPDDIVSAPDVADDLAQLVQALDPYAVPIDPYATDPSTCGGSAPPLGRRRSREAGRAGAVRRAAWRPQAPTPRPTCCSTSCRTP